MFLCVFQPQTQCGTGLVVFKYYLDSLLVSHQPSGPDNASAVSRDLNKIGIRACPELMPSPASAYI